MIVNQCEIIIDLIERSNLYVELKVHTAGPRGFLNCDKFKCNPLGPPQCVLYRCAYFGYLFYLDTYI